MKKKENFLEKCSQLIADLEEMGYSRHYIRKVEIELRKINTLMIDNEWTSCENLYHYYDVSGKARNTLRDKRAVLGIIAKYNNENFNPIGKYIKSHKNTMDEAINGLSKDYQAFIRLYCKLVAQRDISKNSLYSTTWCAISFLRYLQNQGIIALSEVDENSVISFFFHGDKVFSGSYMNHIRYSFIVCSSEMDCCATIASYFPSLRDIRNRNIQYLTAEEVKSIKEVVRDTTCLKHRERAIGTLLLYTGLRACDIAALKLSDIKWNKETISICQKKTMTALNLPLMTVVGNALYDYIVKERPECNCPEVFVSRVKPIRPLSSNTVRNHICDLIFNAANIRMDKGERRGSHVFRYHLATALMENETTLPIISSILGHTSSSSLERYLKADFRHLKECSISIEKFPVRKEELL